MKVKSMRLEITAEVGKIVISLDGWVITAFSHREKFLFIMDEWASVFPHPLGNGFVRANVTSLISFLGVGGGGGGGGGGGWGGGGSLFFFESNLCTGVLLSHNGTVPLLQTLPALLFVIFASYSRAKHTLVSGFDSDSVCVCVCVCAHHCVVCASSYNIYLQCCVCMCTCVCMCGLVSLLGVWVHMHYKCKFKSLCVCVYLCVSVTVYVYIPLFLIIDCSNLYFRRYTINPILSNIKAFACSLCCQATGHTGAPVLADNRPSSSPGMNGKKQKSRLENILFKLKKSDAEADPASVTSDPASPDQSSNSHGSGEASNGREYTAVLPGSRASADTVTNRRTSRKPTRREKLPEQVDPQSAEDLSTGDYLSQEGELENKLQKPYDDEETKAAVDNALKFQIKLERADSQDWACTFGGVADAFSREQGEKSAYMNANPCHKCGASFASPQELEMHLRAHVKEEAKDFSVFPCYICGKSFSTEAFLSQHVIAHDREARQSDQEKAKLDETGARKLSHSCSLCRRGFPSDDALQLHKCTKGLMKPFGCGHCGRCFTQYSHLSSHLAQHQTGFAPELTCYECGQRFMYSIELRRHIEVHIKAELAAAMSGRGAGQSSSTVTSAGAEGPDTSSGAGEGSESGSRPQGSLKLTIPVSRFMPKKKIRKRGPPKISPCPVCGKIFSQHGYLTMHMRVHREKQYECSYCSKKFTFKKSLEIHTRSHTGEKPFCCQFCNKAFTRQDSLQKHERLHMGVKPYVCETCGRQYSDKFELQRHSLSHLKVKPHKCTLCNKAYSDKKRLKEHMFNHSGNLPYVCEICGKGFARKYRYTLHLSQHSGEVRFHCEICKKGFYRRSDLNSHRETHSNKKPFACDVCGVGFLRESYLRRHMIVHSSDKPHHCSICGKDFARKNTLNRHILIHKRRAEEGLEDEFGEANDRYSRYTTDFGYGISGSVAPLAVPNVEERDIIKDIQAVIGLDQDADIFHKFHWVGRSRTRGDIYAPHSVCVACDTDINTRRLSIELVHVELDN